jgi:hypothetical protein
VHKAQQLTSLAMDVSAGSGKSLEAVSTALAKAQNGNVSALGRLGIATKDAHGKTLSLHDVTKKLATTFRGQASKAANTTAGRMQRLKVQLSEAGESIGAKLLPLGNKLAAWALKMVPKVQQLGADLSKRLGPAFRAVGSFISTKVVPAAQNFVHWYMDKIVPGIKRFLIPILDAGKKNFDKIKDAIHKNSPELQKIGTALQKVGEFIANKVMPPAGKLLGFLAKLGGNNMATAITLVGRMVDAMSNLAGKVESVVHWLGNIHWPSPPGWLSKVGDVLGSTGDLVTVGPQLAGRGPSLAPGAGLSTAASAATSTWWATVRAAPAAAGWPAPTSTRAPRCASTVRWTPTRWPGSSSSCWHAGSAGWASWRVRRERLPGDGAAGHRYLDRQQ